MQIKETKEQQDAYIKDISDVLKTSLDAENIDYVLKDAQNQYIRFVEK
jgi:GTP pyrophosphokinase